MSFAVLTRNGVRLRYSDTGEGLPVIFQHGLGGAEAQVAGIFPQLAGVRRITLECRGQGQSEFGPREQFLIADFAGDVEALIRHLGIERPVIGGISMGAAIALRLAAGAPQRYAGLVLARPAWLFAPAPENMHAYALVGNLLQSHAPDDARRLFAASSVAARLAALAPDNLASLLGFFGRPDPETFGALLAAIAGDGPGVSEAQTAGLELPALVIGHDTDLAHPLPYAERLAGLLPHGQLAVITPKAIDPAAYTRDFRAVLETFLLTFG